MSEACETIQFQDLGLSKGLCSSLKEMKITKPTSVQRHCLKPVLSGSSMLVRANTGSGKTLVFILPIIQKLLLQPKPYYALVLCPTRELAIQNFKVAECYKAHLKIELVIGGVNRVKQGNLLKQNVNVIIATPGRVADHVRNNNISFANLGVLVLDEADELLAGNFGTDLETIFKSFPQDSKHQTILVSATLPESLNNKLQDIAASAKERGKPPVLFWEENMPEPREFCEHFDKTTSDANALLPGEMWKSKSVEENCVKTVNLLQQYYLGTNFKEAYLVAILQKFLKDTSHSQCIVFTNKCDWVVTLHLLLRAMNFDSCVYLHANAKQVDRERAMKQFKSHQARILISTNVASRGLDLPFVDLVINHAVNEAPEDYVHRVGRTARAGMGGKAISLFSIKEISRLETVQNFIGKKLERLSTEYDNDVQKIVEEVALHTAKFFADMKTMKEDRNLFKKEINQKIRELAEDESASEPKKRKRQRKLKWTKKHHEEKKVKTDL